MTVTHFSSILKKQLSRYPATESGFRQALFQTFLDSDRNYLKLLRDKDSNEAAKYGYRYIPGKTKPLNMMGSCSLSVLLRDNKAFCANAGDSRAVLARKVGGQLLAVPLSSDHNTYNETEVAVVRARSSDPDAVRRHANDVDCIGPTRVGGHLMVTRSIGDMYLKDAEFSILPPQYLPYITADPEITVQPLDSTAEFLVLASDGLWEHMSNEEVVETVANFQGPNVADHLLMSVLKKVAAQRDMAVEVLTCIPLGLKRFFHDDITILVIFLHGNPRQ
eukprot:gnl/Spiro4/18592_TR9970_c0_g1_i1.p1 gnl/Spiro4/18592_TR9970_c0_g1~~gnl/Spiro4/18592_TR9970_c0_g1_i1.p1  ORF type:complete len:277 (+),score=61.25 gnl/Spiro4/18592_TR9970_c0_g1_i1:385-1215(+)